MSTFWAVRTEMFMSWKNNFHKHSLFLTKCPTFRAIKLVACP